MILTGFNCKLLEISNTLIVVLAFIASQVAARSESVKLQERKKTTWSFFDVSTLKTKMLLLKINYLQFRPWILLIISFWLPRLWCLARFVIISINGIPIKEYVDKRAVVSINVADELDEC